MSCLLTAHPVLYPHNQQQLLFTSHPSWNTLKAMKGLILSHTTYSHVELISALTYINTLTGIIDAVFSHDHVVDLLV